MGGVKKKHRIVSEIIAFYGFDATLLNQETIQGLFANISTITARRMIDEASPNVPLSSMKAILARAYPEKRDEPIRQRLLDHHAARIVDNQINAASRKS